MDPIFLIVRVLYNFESNLKNTIYKYYTIAITINRSRSIGTTRSTSRRYYRYKEE